MKVRPSGPPLGCVAILLLSTPAAAEQSRGTCDGGHSLASPLPDECLETIETDRPHQTDTPHVVPAGHAQFESALVAAALGGTLADPGARSARGIFFENAYRFGIVSDVDLQLTFKHAEYVPAEKRFVAPGPLNVRVKLNLVHEADWVPAITLVPTIFVPMDPSHALRGGPLVFWGWELPLNFELEMNAGILFSTSPKPSHAVVLASALTLPVVGGLKTFLDIYATGGDVALGTGFLLPLGRDVQIDAGTYAGVAGDEPAVTPFLGLSFRR